MQARAVTGPAALDRCGWYEKLRLKPSCGRSSAGTFLPGQTCTPLPTGRAFTCKGCLGKESPTKAELGDHWEQPVSPWLRSSWQHRDPSSAEEFCTGDKLVRSCSFLWCILMSWGKRVYSLPYPIPPPAAKGAEGFYCQRRGHTNPQVCLWGMSHKSQYLPAALSYPETSCVLRDKIFHPSK